MNEKVESLLTTIRSSACLCFDAEFARGVEMLELSAVNLEGKLIYTQRFKPQRYRTWESNIHHITPEMVAKEPKFSSCRRRIQALVDRCGYILGFAVRENDMTKMKRQHIHMLDSKTVLELRDWFWICFGREHGFDYQQGISLKFCCEQLGVEHDAEHAHASAFDAAITLKCFKILFERFVMQYDKERNFQSFRDVVKFFSSIYKKYKHEYDMQRAAGYCFISRTEEGGYQVKASSERPEAADNLVACVHVADRKVAMARFGNYLFREPRRRNFMVEELTEKQLRYFRRLGSGE